MLSLRTSTGRLFTILTGVYSLVYFNLLNKHGQQRHPNAVVRDDKALGVIDNPLMANNTDSSITNHHFTLMDLLEQSPSVDYFSCCGAGHRFSKLSDAYYLAKQIGFGLRVFFGFCDHQEVFSYFFGSQPPEEVLRMISRWNGTKDNLHLKVNNENPGFVKMKRTGGSDNSSCRCDYERLASDVEFYGGIRERFRERDEVEAFREEHFVGKTVIGMHIRAGNGESGDFERKNRTIANIDEWSASMSKLLQGLSNNFTDPPLLFIATDTAHIISNFRTLLKGVMPVVDLSQDRVAHGQGILFGAQGNVESGGEKCLQGWSDSLMDMMILSHADIVVAGRPSSFTQSIPMTMALSKPTVDRKVFKTFCEVNPAASEIRCYESLQDWCCNGVTDFSLHGIQRYDYRRMPRIPGIDPNDYAHHIVARPNGYNDNGSTICKPRPERRRHCLPYAMLDPEAMKKAEYEENRMHRMNKWTESRK